MSNVLTVKGRVGGFEYGYVGSQRWIVRDRRSGETVATARDLSGASQEARRLWAKGQRVIENPNGAGFMAAGRWFETAGEARDAINAGAL